MAEAIKIWYSYLMVRRLERVAELLRQQLAIMIEETFPDEVGMVTVTDITLSSDIKNATVYISCFDKKSEVRVLEILNDKTKDFQRVLGRQLRMRYTPKLNFKFDKGLEKINRVEEILEGIK
jgi:ribosome-binding factor A